MTGERAVAKVGCNALARCMRFAALCAFLGAGGPLLAPAIRGGTPTVTISSTDLSSGAGTDLVDNKAYTGSHLVSMTGFSSFYRWEMDVVLSSGSTMPSGTSVWVRRSNNGGNGTVSGGDTNMQITSTQQQFFIGTGNTSSDIVIVYTVMGLGLSNCPTGTYTFPITYLFGDRA